MSNINSLLYNNYSINNNDLEVHVSTKYKTENLKIPHFEICPSTIVNKSVILYGESGTGKTQIIRDIMYKCKESFPEVIVFCPTNEENHDYDGYIPDCLIYDEFDLNNITSVYERQKNKAMRYNNVNDINNLKSIYDIIKNNRTEKFHNKMLEFETKNLNNISRIVNDGERKNKRDEFNKYIKNKFIDFYKKCIKINLTSVHKLSNYQKQLVNDLDINPKILVIFDDAMEEIKSLIKIGNKENNQVIKNFFFKGRHAHITHIYTFQNEDKLDASIKKNAFYSVFTTPDSAKGFFSKANMCQSPHDKKKVEICSDEIFGDGEKKYRVMIYSRLDYKTPFKYFKADLHDDFKMCSNIIWDFCNLIEDKNKLF